VKPRFLHERTSIPIEYGAGWNPETICLFWRREKSLAAVRICVNNSVITVILHYAGRAIQARQVSTEEPDKVSRSDSEGGALLVQLYDPTWGGGASHPCT
jgi:hypothetical protein